MIGLRMPNGERLDMPQDASIGFALVSPVFSGEVGYGSQSFSFQLPATPRNSAELKHPDLPSTRANQTQYTVGLEWNGQPLSQGVMRIEKAARNGYSASLTLNYAAINKLLSEKSLRQYDLGGTRVISSASDPAVQSDAMREHARQTALGINGPHDYVFFPVYNEGMYPGQSGFEPVDSVQNWWWDGQFFDEVTWTAHPDNQNPLPKPGIMVLTPFFKLNYLLAQLFEQNEYEFQNNAWASGSELDSLCLYNTQSLNRIGGQHVGQIVSEEHVPDVNAQTFFRGLRDLLGLVALVQGNTLRLTSLQSIATDTAQIDWRGKTVSYVTDFSEVEGYEYFSEQEPEDALTQNAEGPLPIIGTATDQADLPGSATTGDIYFTQVENQYWAYESGQWQALSPRLHPVGEGQERTSPISTLPQMYRGDWWDDETWTIPRTEQRLTGRTYSIFGTYRQAYVPRLIFYRGITGTPSYPQGSTNDVGGAYQNSLHWHGERGLYARRWQTWDELISTAKQVTFKLKLDAAELFSVQWDKRHRLRTHEGEVVGYLEKIEFNLTAGGADLATVKMRVI